MDFIKACDEEGIHPVAGIEFREGNRYLYTGVAKNNEGFRELNEFLSEHRLERVVQYADQILYMPGPGAAPTIGDPREVERQIIGKCI